MPKRKEIDPQKLKELAGLGLTQKEMAGNLGMGESTFYERLQEKPELVEVIEQGRALAAEQVTNALFQLCLKGNLGAIIWFEKTRRGIKDTIEVTARTMSDQELIEKADSIVRKVRNGS